MRILAPISLLAVIASVCAITVSTLGHDAARNGRAQVSEIEQGVPPLLPMTATAAAAPRR